MHRECLAQGLHKKVFEYYASKWLMQISLLSNFVPLSLMCQQLLLVQWHAITWEKSSIHTPATRGNISWILRTDYETSLVCFIHHVVTINSDMFSVSMQIVAIQEYDGVSYEESSWSAALFNGSRCRSEINHNVTKWAFARLYQLLSQILVIKYSHIKLEMHIATAVVLTTHIKISSTMCRNHQ